MDRGAWLAIVSPWGGKESDTTEQFHFHLLVTRRTDSTEGQKEVVNTLCSYHHHCRETGGFPKVS